MKKKILDALRAKFEGVSDTILDRVAARLAKTVTDDAGAEEAVEAVTFQQVLESYGDSRATDAQKTAVLNYERKHGLKDGRRVATEAAPTDGNDTNTDNGAGTATPQAPAGGSEAAGVPSWAQALIDSNRALTARLDAMDGERTATGRRQQVERLTAALPQAMRKAYARLDVAAMSDDQFAALMDELPAEVDELKRAETSRGAVFQRPGAAGKRQTDTEGNAPQATEAEVNAVLDTMRV